MDHNYYAVYLCGDALPSAIFLEKEDAEEFPQNRPRWMDKEIKPIYIDINLIKRYEC